MWARAKGRGPTLLALLAVLGALGITALTGGSAPAQAPAGSPSSESGATATPPPGSLVVALPALGRVNALKDGETYTLAAGLATPSAVAVLSDSSVLVAEQGANRVSGFGGRFGPVPVTIAGVAGPTGLVVGPGDIVYVTGSGEVGRIDLATGRYQTVAGGFTAPIGPALNGTILYVPDLATGRVATIDTATGSDLGSAATGLASPGGAATAPGLPLFVTETQDAGVVTVDPGGTPGPFATVVGALQLALDPADPAPGSAWTLVVTTQTGLTRLNPDGSVVGLRTSLQGVAGVAVTPDSSAAQASATSDSGTTAVLKDEPSSSSSSLAVIVALVALLVLVVVGVTLWFARRAGRREREDDGDMSSPPDPADLAPVFGSCAAEETEVDRLQELLRHVTIQANEANTRRRRAAELASDARDRAMRALEVRTSIRAARLKAEPLPDSEKLSWAQLSFSTNEGREAFESYRRREIDGAQLKTRLSELGETTAITQISEAGRRQMRSDPTVPWPEERDAVHDAIAAREELRAHVTEVDEAQAESDQLGAQLQDLTEELDEARRRLEECRQAAKP